MGLLGLRHSLFVRWIVESKLQQLFCFVFVYSDCAFYETKTSLLVSSFILIRLFVYLLIYIFQLSKDQRRVLTDSYVASSAKKAIEQRLLGFLNYNSYHLPMYAKPGMV